MAETCILQSRTSDPGSVNDVLIAALQLERAQQQEINAGQERRIHYLNSLVHLDNTGSVAQNRRLDQRRQRQEAKVQSLEREVTRMRVASQQQHAQIASLREQCARRECNEETLALAEAEYQADIHELTQARSDEMEELRRQLDKQGLPPAYADIDQRPNTPLKDAGPAIPDVVISSAVILVRRAIAEAPHPIHNRDSRVVRIARAFHSAVDSINRGLTSGTWPASSSSKVLHAVIEIGDRVALCISDDLNDSRQQGARLLPAHQGPQAEDASRRKLRHAFIAADSLAFEALLLHSSSGGRRQELSNTPLPFIVVANSISDRRDEFEDLHYWRQRLERIASDITRVDPTLGTTVFYNSLRWLEDALITASTGME